VLLLGLIAINAAPFSVMHGAVPVGVAVYADGTRMIYQVDPQSGTKLAAAAEKDKDPMKQTCVGVPCADGRSDRLN
jgi:hypothetical protein